MIESMAQLHMTGAELARDLHAVLERVRQGAEVVVEEGHRRVALIKPVEGPRRPIDECIAIARARGFDDGLDEDFAIHRNGSNPRLQRRDSRGEAPSA